MNKSMLKKTKTSNLSLWIILLHLGTERGRGAQRLIQAETGRTDRVREAGEKRERGRRTEVFH